MIWYQKDKPVVPKDANYDYTKVYDNNNNFIGWIRIYYECIGGLMMGRLIDADKFTQQITGMTLVNNYSVNKALALCKLIDSQPTAYDVDKVVEQLEELTEEECTLHECGIRSERCKPCIAKKAIEIVKAGGIDER